MLSLMSGLILNRSILVVRLWHLESKDIELRQFMSIVFAAMVFAAPSAGVAQPTDWRDVAQEAIPVVVPFARDYEIANLRQLPLHFTASFPLLEDRITIQTRPMTTGNIYEARILSLDGALLEYLTVSAGTITQGPADGRMQSVYNVVTNFVYPSIGFPADAEVFGGRIAEFGGYPALEFMARSSVEGQDPLAARIVGVVAPNGVDVVFFLQLTVPNRVQINGPDDLLLTYLGRVADTVVFTAYRDASGAMVPF